MPVARQIRVHGRVQGVFFRDTCRREARARGVFGWVSNEPDGTVLAHLEGDERDVEAVVDWCRTGSSRAHVDGVDVAEVQPEGLRDFVVR